MVALLENLSILTGPAAITRLARPDGSTAAITRMDVASSQDVNALVRIGEVGVEDRSGREVVIRFQSTGRDFKWQEGRWRPEWGGELLNAGPSD